MSVDTTAWYYSHDRQEQLGPIDSDALRALAGQGTLHPDTLVWREGLPQWLPLHSVAAELGLALSGPSAMVDAPASALDRPATPLPVSPYAAPDTDDLIVSAPVHGGEVVYAGFWKRAAAILIDTVVITVASWAVQIPLLVLVGVGAAALGGAGIGDTPLSALAVIVIAYGLGVIIPLLYMAWMHSSPSQATLGKMAVGIKVTRTDGRRISFWRAFARYWAYIPSTLVLMIGYLMAAFTRRKQALHDMLCDTLVVDKWAYTEHPEWQKRELGVVTIVILVLGAVLILVVFGLFALFGALMANQ